MTNRREFLQVAVGTAGLIGLHASGIVHAAEAAEPVARAGKSLKILVLGGTGFIGPHEIEYALARGHEITVFNRGRKSGLYGNRVEEIVGNRDTKIDEGLKPLAGDRTWDVVIDNSGYVPRHVRDAVELLGDRCRRYLYISTVAVYDTDAADHFDEDGPLAKLDDPTIEEVTWETYGPLKAECDRIVRGALGDRATIVRPTFIIGPGDTSDRFTYWVDRIHRGGDIVGPANAEVALQFVDVRDLCPWIIHLAEKDIAGVFNTAGPAWTREGLLWGIRATASKACRFHWPTPELAAELEMPAPMLDWGSESNTWGNQASLAAGMTYRTLADSATATLEWWRQQPSERRLAARGWPTAEQEKKALERLEK
jgi:2'-hydroxyisoflavone reductase